METVIQALWGVAALAVTTLGGFAVQAIRQYGMNLIQQRLGVGAARVAGEIVAEVIARPDVQQATDVMLAFGVDKLRERFPDTASKIGADTLKGMIAGELGRLGMGVAR